MVDTLVGKTCTPCKGGIPPLSPQEAEGLHAQIPQWDVRGDAEGQPAFGRYADPPRPEEVVQQTFCGT